MFKTPFVIATLVALLFGAAGATVAAARESQPGDPLYAVKLWSEQVQNRVQVNTRTQIQINQPTAVPGSGLMTQEQNRIQVRQENRIQASGSAAPLEPKGGNPWTDGTPTPGSSYGPGPGTCTTCTPQPQHQSGGGSSNEPGPNNGNRP
jgi:hypothetical protein